MSIEPRKIALVTGAGRRIGRAIALELARAGYALALHVNASAADGKAVAGEIEALGAKASVLNADLSDSAACTGLIGACARAFGRAPDCLVNNASLFGFDDPLTLSADSFDRHIAVNLRAPLLLISEMARTLPKGVAGVVVNILDQRVLRPRAEHFSYGLAKSGLATATPILARALAPKIRVVGIAPGPTLASVHQTPETFADEASSTPLGLGPSPQTIAQWVRLVAEEPAITGAVIPVDGGQHLADTPAERNA